MRNPSAMRRQLKLALQVKRPCKPVISGVAVGISESIHLCESRQTEGRLVVEGTEASRIDIHKKNWILLCR